jgi:hypothetical protein
MTDHGAHLSAQMVDMWVQKQEWFIDVDDALILGSDLAFRVCSSRIQLLRRGRLAELTSTEYPKTCQILLNISRSDAHECFWVTYLLSNHRLLEGSVK